jgi:hypothetical protein
MAAGAGHLRALTPHQELAAQLRAARERVMEAVAGLGDEQASRPGADGWSVKDHLTHITLWHEMRFFEISRIARGGTDSFPSSGEGRITPLNEAFAENRRQLPLAQVLADLEFAWEMVAQAVAACPQERLDERLYAEIGIPGGAEHDIEHAGAIQALRRQLS